MANVAAKANENDAVVQWVTFRLADETYGINVMQVQEVLRVSEIAPVPGAPHYVLGIINLRGNVVTVVDTRIRLGLKRSSICGVGFGAGSRSAGRAARHPFGVGAHGL